MMLNSGKVMTDNDRKAAGQSRQQALDATDHPDKAVSLLMTAGMTILQRWYGAEAAIEYMTTALDAADANLLAAIYVSS